MADNSMLMLSCPTNLHDKNEDAGDSDDDTKMIKMDWNTWREYQHFIFLYSFSFFFIYQREKAYSM